jgi:hypothetical protein
VKRVDRNANARVTEAPHPSKRSSAGANSKVSDRAAGANRCSRRLEIDQYPEAGLSFPMKTPFLRVFRQTGWVNTDAPSTDE